MIRLMVEPLICGSLFNRNLKNCIARYGFKEAWGMEKAQGRPTGMDLRKPGAWKRPRGGLQEWI